MYNGLPSMSLRTAAAACFEVPLKPDAKYSDISQEIPESWRRLSVETIDARPAELTLWSRSGLEGVIANRKDWCYEIDAKPCLA